MRRPEKESRRRASCGCILSTGTEKVLNMSSVEPPAVLFRGLKPRLEHRLKQRLKDHLRCSSLKRQAAVDASKKLFFNRFCRS